MSAAVATAPRARARSQLRVPVAIVLLFSWEALLVIGHGARGAAPATVEAIDQWLDLTNELGIGTWFSSLQLAAVAAVWGASTYVGLRVEPGGAPAAARAPSCRRSWRCSS
jgi:hypothetical protein